LLLVLAAHESAITCAHSPYISRLRGKTDKSRLHEENKTSWEIPMEIQEYDFMGKTSMET
jgi:hypothetical protein